MISRSGTPITDDVFDYNVLVVDQADSLPNNQTWYFQQRADTYVAIPPAASGTLALALTNDAPHFDKLTAAIDAVLADDPGGVTLATQASSARASAAVRGGDRLEPHLL